MTFQKGNDWRITRVKYYWHNAETFYLVSMFSCPHDIFMALTGIYLGRLCDKPEIQTQYFLNRSHNPYCYSNFPDVSDFESLTCHKAPWLLLRNAQTLTLSPPTESSHCCIWIPPGHFHVTNSLQNDGPMCVGNSATQLNTNTAHCELKRKATAGVILDINLTHSNHIYCLTHEWAWCKEKRVPN
jgi:hypothetical protein